MPSYTQCRGKGIRSCAGLVAALCYAAQRRHRLLHVQNGKGLLVQVQHLMLAGGGREGIGFARVGGLPGRGSRRFRILRRKALGRL